MSEKGDNGNYYQSDTKIIVNEHEEQSDNRGTNHPPSEVDNADLQTQREENVVSVMNKDMIKQKSRVKGVTVEQQTLKVEKIVSGMNKVMIKQKSRVKGVIQDMESVELSLIKEEKVEGYYAPEQIEMESLTMQKYKTLKEIDKYSNYQNNRNIKFQKLEHHINKFHPKKQDNNDFDGKISQKSFSPFDKLGNLFPGICAKRNTSPLARQFGLGHSLYLMSTCSFVVLFIILSLVNLPLLFIYAYGDGDWIAEAAIQQFINKLEQNTTYQKCNQQALICSDGSVFEMFTDAAILGNNFQKYPELDLNECAQKCVQMGENGITKKKCLSFEFVQNPKIKNGKPTCFLSIISKNEVDELKYGFSETKYDFYERLSEKSNIKNNEKITCRSVSSKDNEACYLIKSFKDNIEEDDAALSTSFIQKLSNLISIVPKFSLGNIGSSYVTCSNSNYAGIINAYVENNKVWFNGNQTVKMECSDNSKLGSLVEVGISRDINSSCNAITQNPFYMDSYFHKYLKSRNVKPKSLESYFGSQNTSMSGLSCKKWNSQDIQDEDYGWLTDVHSNYCRYYKPINSLRCFTDDKNLMWEECQPNDVQTLFDQNMQYSAPQPYQSKEKEKFVKMMGKLFCEYTDLELYKEKFDYTITEKYWQNQEFYDKIDISSNCKSNRYDTQYDISQLVQYWKAYYGITKKEDSLYVPEQWYLGPHLKIHYEYNRLVNFTSKELIQEVAKGFYQLKHFNNYKYRQMMMNETDFLMYTRASSSFNARSDNYLTNLHLHQTFIKNCIPDSKNGYRTSSGFNLGFPEDCQSDKPQNKFNGCQYYEACQKRIEIIPDYSKVYSQGLNSNEKRLYSQYVNQYANEVKLRQNEFQKIKEKYKEEIDSFDSSINLLYYERPKSWFELQYNIKCKGQQSCQLPVAAITEPIFENHMGISNLNLRKSQSVNWGFSYSALKELFKRYKNGDGKYYWSQYANEQPNLMIVAECEVKEFRDPISGEQISKVKLGIFIALIDMIVLIIIYVYSYSLEDNQLKYIEKFREPIEMDDFTISVLNLPKDILYQNNPQILQATLWSHFEDVVKDQITKEQQGGITDIPIELINLITEYEQSANLNSFEDAKSYPWEIVDVNLGRVGKQDIDILDQMQTIRDKFLLNKKRIDECDPQYNQENMSFWQIFQKKQMTVNDYLEENRILSAEFDSLMEKYRKVENNEEIDNGYIQRFIDQISTKKQEETKSTIIAFITFRSMSGAEAALKAYQPEGSGIFKNIITRPDLQLFGQFPIIQRASDPINVQWKNFGIPVAERKVRNILNIIFACFILFIALTILSIFKNIASNLLGNPQFKEISCSYQPTDAEVAFDMTLVEGQRKNMLDCYCQGKILNGNSYSEVMNIDFSEFKYFNRQKFLQFLKIKGSKDESKFDFTSDMPQELKYPCRKYFQEQDSSYKLKFYFAIMLVLLNYVVSNIFSRLIPFERKQTQEGNFKSIFNKEFSSQLIIFGLFVIVANFDVLQFLGFEATSIQKDDFSAFNAKFYLNLGEIIFASFSIQIMLTCAQPLFKTLKNLFHRASDRQFKWNIRRRQNRATIHMKKKEINDGGSDASSLYGKSLKSGSVIYTRPNSSHQKETSFSAKEQEICDINTKLTLQEDVNDLYTGHQIDLSILYAQGVAFFWCIMIYSTGLPLLYPLAIIFFASQYVIHYLLSLYFYQRSSNYNEHLPLYTIKFIKMGIFIHIISSLILLIDDNLIPGQYTKVGYVSSLKYSVIDFVPNGDQWVKLWYRIVGKYHSFIYIGIALLFLFAMTFQHKLIQILSKLEYPYILKNILDLMNKQSEDPTVKAYSNDILKELQISSLQDLYYRAEIEYQAFNSEFSTISKKDLLRKCAQNNIRDDKSIFKQEQRLLRRINQLKAVINSQLHYLKTEKGKPGKSITQQSIALFWEKYDNISYQDKLNKLIDNQEILVSDWRDQGIEARCRLVGLSQSYNMIDSLQFKRIKALKEILSEQQTTQINYFQ